MKIKDVEKMIIKYITENKKTIFINSRIVVLKIPEIQSRSNAGRGLSYLKKKGILKKHTGFSHRINYTIDRELLKREVMK